jgi:hypothetical protein
MARIVNEPSTARELRCRLPAGTLYEEAVASFRPHAASAHAPVGPRRDKVACAWQVPHPGA